MGWRDSAFTLVTTVIGSGLVVFVATSAYNIINQPYISLILKSVFVNGHVPRISYYELIAKNTGATQATNLTLSMFFVGNLTHAEAVLYDQNVTLKKELPNTPNSSL